MLKLLSRIALLLIFAAIAGGIYFFPELKQTHTRQQVNDLLIEMQPDAAIQAGFMQNMHEQQWGSSTFLNFFGLKLPLGTTETTVRAPVKVYYGIRPKNLHFQSLKDGVLLLTVDKVEVLSVDADISRLEMKTTVGWARLDAFSGKTARQQAKLAFEDSKRHAADQMLQSLEVTAQTRAAVVAIFLNIPGIREVGIDRKDRIPLALPKASH